jgi:limonene-1,2-epoxide hydrolase
MSREHCLSFMSDLESRDLDRLKKWFCETSKLWMPPTAPIEGQRRILALFRTIFRMYSEIHWKVSDVHAIGENRFIYLTDSWGVIGEDTSYKNHILTLIEFSPEGQILYLSDYFKDTAIFKTGRKHAGTE